MRKTNAKDEPAKDASAAPRRTQSADERRAIGKALREATPRAAHGGWKPPKDRRDPVELLRESNEGRNLGADPDPLRTHGPIAFRLLSRRGRGHGGRSGFDPDLRTSRAGLRRRSPYEFRVVCHAGTQSVFDINDFDETLHAPWEWDLKRLATSFVVAAGIRPARQRSRDVVVGRALVP